jgi:hypothetical protein
MKQASVRLQSISPYSQSRHYEEPKRDGEGHRDYEARTWRERLHANANGDVFIPPMAFKVCLDDAARFLGIGIPGKGKSTFTKHFEAGVLVVEPVVLPIKKKDVPGEWLFVPSDGKAGGGKRVDKCFPIISEWEADVTFYVLDETVLQSITTPHGKMTAFEYVVGRAGEFIGIGRFRPRNRGFYGRFKLLSAVKLADG